MAGLQPVPYTTELIQINVQSNLTTTAGAGLQPVPYKQD